MTHNRDHVVISSLKQQVVIFDNGRPRGVKVWHFLVGLPLLGFIAGAWWL